MFQDKGYSSYYIFNRFFLTGCGIWPYGSTCLLKFFRYFWITQQIFLMSAKIIKIFEIRYDIDTVIEAVATLFYNIAATVKYCNGVINEKKMKFLVDKIHTDWKNVSDPMEIDILSRHSSRGKLLNILYIASVYNALLSYLLLPLSPIIMDIFMPLNESRPRQPLLIAEFFIDENKYFYSMTTYAYMTCLYGIIPLLGTDTFYMNCVHHICGMTVILSRRIKNNINGSKKELLRTKYQRTVDCIINHQSIIEFGDGINAMYNTSFFIIIFLNTTLLTFTGVAALIKFNEGNKYEDVVRFGMFGVAEVFHLFCNNYMGQLVVNSGDEFRKNIFNSEWYQAPIKVRELVHFIQLRNSRPILMKAGIFPLCLPNFTVVLKSSMSYFAFLQSTRY
ncbi:odorant receptor Or2-like [Trichogramma pretiosum]|uniref:odorant receptor Or2-like n=1 Tax=Trichogramma pretiosum TaxID=7493 RepID=UPI0006C96184|nr:odorant receptor Or2-like [Trichogramma pretiosum]